MQKGMANRPSGGPHGSAPVVYASESPPPLECPVTCYKLIDHGKGDDPMSIFPEVDSDFLADYPSPAGLQEASYHIVTAYAGGQGTTNCGDLRNKGQPPAGNQ